MRRLGVGWLYDAAEHRRRNRAGENYWQLYCDEILSRLGVCAEEAPPDELADTLDDLAVLIVAGDCAAHAESLERFVTGGGILIGFDPGGLDRLFGIAETGRLAPPGEFAIAGYLHYQPHALTAGLLERGHPEQPLIVLSPLRLARSAETLAEVLAPAAEAPGDGRLARPTGWASMAARRLGAGWAVWFGFDLPRTVWLLHQGRPIDADHDGDGYRRSMDARLIADNEPEVPYADLLVFLLQRVIGLAPVPMIDPLPPLDGRPADLLLYFGGDDEATPGIQVPASEFMRGQGLPYHINLLPVGDGFAVDDDEMAAVHRNRHELSLHYNFIDGFEHPSGFTRADVLEQAELFRRILGRDPVCTVNHWCRWTGSCEPIRWMMEAGQIADNGWMGLRPPPLNPVDRIDFSFGTAFPRRPYDDAAHDNRCLEFVIEHVVAYEVGYLDAETDFATLHRALDLAARWRMTMNFFYHPVYLARFPACQAAIVELRRYLAERGLGAVFMGNDELAVWWLERAQATVSDAVRRDDGSLTFSAWCGHRDGYVVRLCHPAAEVTVDGLPIEAARRRELGADWLYIPLSPGVHGVIVRPEE